MTIVTIEDEAKKTSAYNDIEKVIIINSLYLPHADLEEALQETLHTAFLAYEHYICDNLDYSHRLTYSPFYERALSWKDVLDNPYSQYIGDSRETEIDARLYSIDRLEIYKKAFDIYLEEEMERNEEFNKYNSSAETDTNDEF